MRPTRSGGLNLCKGSLFGFGYSLFLKETKNDICELDGICFIQRCRLHIFRMCSLWWMKSTGIYVLTKRSRRLLEISSCLSWSSNVWAGVSVENADYLYRIDNLRGVPSAVRFILTSSRALPSGILYRRDLLKVNACLILRDVSVSGGQGN